MSETKKQTGKQRPSLLIAPPARERIFTHVADWPDWEAFSDMPVFNSKAVVQITGMSASTLRAWEKRYQLLAPRRADNAYRLYSERDLALIRWLKDRVDSGIAISQAVALFHHLQTLPQQETATVAPVDVMPDTTDAFSFQVPATQTGGQPQFWSSYLIPRQMSTLCDHLIVLFQEMNEQQAYALIASALAVHPIEQICTDVITPTLWQIGQLWSEGKLTTAIEHFASNFFRSLLMNHLHTVPSPLQGPLILIGNAPQEMHELGALMLTLFLRRSKMRVAYLGQNIEAGGLLDTIHRLRPAMICFSLTLPPHLPALITLGEAVQRLPEPRPILVFGGQGFTLLPPSGLTHLPGYYLSGDLSSVTAKIGVLARQQEQEE